MACGSLTSKIFDVYQGSVGSQLMSRPTLCGFRRAYNTRVEARRRGEGPERNSRKGKNYENKRRRRGRPEWLRSPDDTPLRDGNRDRVIGLLTQRAARTLCYYLSELNPNVYHWLTVFMKNHPIPRDGAWDDVSGESFLRLLLSMPIEHANYNTGVVYTTNRGCGVDPRNIAQRIMEIRSAIAKEMIQDLQQIGEENSLLMRETIQKSFSLSLDNVVSHPLDDKDTVPEDSAAKDTAAVDTAVKEAVTEGAATNANTLDEVANTKADTEEETGKDAAPEAPIVEDLQKTDAVVEELVSSDSAVAEVAAAAAEAIANDAATLEDSTAEGAPAEASPLDQAATEDAAVEISTATEAVLKDSAAKGAVLEGLSSGEGSDKALKDTAPEEVAAEEVSEKTTPPTTASEAAISEGATPKDSPAVVDTALEEITSKVSALEDTISKTASTEKEDLPIETAASADVEGDVVSKDGGEDVIEKGPVSEGKTKDSASDVPPPKDSA